MRIKVSTLAAGAAIGVASVTGVALAGAALLPATAATATQDAPDQSFLADRLERITEALSGLVGDGTITQDQADTVARTLSEADTLGPHGPGHGMRGGPGGGVALDTAAEVLGLSTDELRDALHDGDTLADVAEAQGVETQTLVDALVAAGAERIDEAVADGRLSEERAAELKTDLPERIAEMAEQGMPGRGTGGMRGGTGGHHDRDGAGWRGDA